MTAKNQNNNSDNLVSVQWLQEHLNDPNLVILDASEESNVAGKVVENANDQIKRARYFDLEKTFSDVDSSLPHTFPSTDQFERESRKLGINENSNIVVYDNLGIYASPRVWWMYKIMGHSSVSVLDGGLPEWIKQGYEVEEKKSNTYPLGNFKALLNDNKIDELGDMVANLATKNKLVIDARSKGRFDGTIPEPRDYVLNGHIPYSINLPFETLLENGKYRSKQDMSAIFDNLKLKDQDLSIVCGSGLTSCIVALALEIVRDNNVSVYDGSWTEWGSNKNLPIEYT